MQMSMRAVFAFRTFLGYKIAGPCKIMYVFIKVHRLLHQMESVICKYLHY